MSVSLNKRHIQILVFILILFFSQIYGTVITKAFSQVSMAEYMEETFYDNLRQSFQSDKDQLSREQYYALARKRVQEIEALSLLIPDSSVGVIDARGDYIFQEDGSFGLCCSGYAKWIADGFYYPLRKKNYRILRYMSIQELRKPWPLLRGSQENLPYEESRQPYFGLDWIRNIAKIFAEEKYQKLFLYNGHDINNSIHSKYVKDRGFPIEDIPMILKEQSILHPERWYLASINGPFGENPTLIQHYHVAVFFPYFTKDKKFQMGVMERTRQTSFEYLLQKHPGTYCHLVWMENDPKMELNLP